MIFYFQDDIWKIIKDYTLDWKSTWHKKLKLCLGPKYIKTLYPTELYGERYDMKTKLYYTTFKVPGKDKIELRVSSSYDIVENNWIDNLNYAMETFI